ncbi:hypothetical protein [Synoicihabitans lomoniglobus]|nr:hypothetical protein [Opitutaceae bacterium LMO-M01]
MLTSNAPFFAPSTTAVPSHPPFARTRKKSTRYRCTTPITARPGLNYRPSGLNDVGDVIGNLISPLRFEGATWTAEGVRRTAAGLIEPGLVSAREAMPYQAISSNGLVAGTVGHPLENRRAWASHLGNFGETFWPESVSFTQGINRDGMVVGKTLFPAAPLLIYRAFVVDASKRPRFLTLPEGGMSDAIGVNDDGVVLVNVTALSQASPRQKAWLWHDDVFIPLEAPPQCSTVATGFSPDGTVIGYRENSFGQRQAVMWVDGHLVDLGVSPAENFIPHAINDHAVIVGSIRKTGGATTAVRWTPRHGLERLADLTDSHYRGTLIDAVAINTSGHIAVVGQRGQTQEGFVLLPPD